MLCTRLMEFSGLAVVGTLSQGYDVEYIWRQVDHGPAKDAAGYYIQASESGGERSVLRGTPSRKHEKDRSVRVLPRVLRYAWLSPMRATRVAPARDDEDEFLRVTSMSDFCRQRPLSPCGVTTAEAD
jgi:hypothetical protein